VPRPRLALASVAVVFGLIAESLGRPALPVADATTGFALIGLGLVASSRRPRTRVGPILAGAGFAWFLGSLWAPAVYLHRAPLAQALLAYPRGRAVSRLERASLAAAYGYAAVYPIADNPYATAAFALALAGVALRRYMGCAGIERRARLAPLVGSTVFALVLAVTAGERLSGANGSHRLLLAYDLAVCLVAGGLFADLLWGRWTQAAVTGVVVDLGAPAAGALETTLARTLGDPQLVVAYWVPHERRYVDEAGAEVSLPDPGSERTLTPIDDDGEPVAALVHESTLLVDPELMSAVASATRLAVSNARLQADVRARVAEVRASRRRIVEAAAGQRRRLEDELHRGAEWRLARVAELIAGIDPGLERQLEDATRELRALARGIHPSALTADGLGAALRELAGRASIPVDITVPSGRFAPAIETACYFVCSEALANVGKHAGASHAWIHLERMDARLAVEIVDDGVGGALPSEGSGLRGLGDRIEALGGRFVVTSPPGRGTRLVAELPCV
jgi:hypothetical protein